MNAELREAVLMTSDNGCSKSRRVALRLVKQNGTQEHIKQKDGQIQNGSRNGDDA